MTYHIYVYRADTCAEWSCLRTWVPPPIRYQQACVSKQTFKTVHLGHGRLGWVVSSQLHIHDKAHGVFLSFFFVCVFFFVSLAWGPNDVAASDPFFFVGGG